MRTLAFMMMVMGLAACAGVSSYQPIGNREADYGYVRIEVSETFHHGGSVPVSVFIKRYDEDGMLAVCGYYMMDASMVDQVVLQAALNDDRSKLVIDGTTIGNLSFLHPNPRHRDVTDADAFCVKTATPWRPGFLGGHVHVQWPAASATL